MNHPHNLKPYAKHWIYDSIPRSLSFITVTAVVVAASLLAGGIWVYEVIKQFNR